MTQLGAMRFREAHNHPNPSKYMSKTMQNHLKRCGAKGGEVFHSLRGDGIDCMRTEKVDSRARRLQAGHLGPLIDSARRAAIELTFIDMLPAALPPRCENVQRGDQLSKARKGPRKKWAYRLAFSSRY
jgi:hypothetical protein